MFLIKSYLGFSNDKTAVPGKRKNSKIRLKMIFWLKMSRARRTTTSYIYFNSDQSILYSFIYISEMHIEALEITSNLIFNIYSPIQHHFKYVSSFLPNRLQMANRDTYILPQKDLSMVVTANPFLLPSIIHHQTMTNTIVATIGTGAVYYARASMFALV